MRKILTNSQTTGDSFDDVPSQFAIIILNPTGNTFPSNVWLEYAIGVKGGVPVADNDLVWERRMSVPFSADVGSGTSGNTLQLVNDIEGMKYRVVTGTAGIEAYTSTVY